MKIRVFLIIGCLLSCSLTRAAKANINIAESFCKDTVLYVFDSTGPVSGASINLSSNSTSSNSFFRVILVDNVNRKYLLAESYKEIADSDNMTKSYADETDVLDGIVPISLEIYVRNVTLNITSVELSLVDRTNTIKESAERTRLPKSKVQEKVDRINAYNKSHDRLWAAGVTDLSLLPFEERMRILGVGPSGNTGGFEYYIGGIFEVGEREEYQRVTRDSPYVDEFDWTNRHGKNWMTSIKGQEQSCYCAAFTGVACVEALTNLYYNQKIDLDLSELEVANCCAHYNNSYFGGLVSSHVTQFLYDTGVCDELSYPFLNDPNDSICRSDQINPQYRAKTSGYCMIPYDQYAYEDSLKKFIIHYGPLVSGFFVSSDSAYDNKPRSHAMALVGYGTIHAGDSIRIISSGSNYWISPSSLSAYYVVPDDSPLIGKTYFKFKNSNNVRPNDDVDGYMHIMFQYLFRMDDPIRLLYPFDITDCQTGLPMYTDADVVCEDADGDGYYFWGLGPKPANCPSTVPDTPDGEDSDPSVGPMDEYGNLSVLVNEIIISSLVEYNTVMNPSHNIRIVNGGQLRITDTTTLQKNAQIIVENGGVLTIDGGILSKARITLCAGSTLLMQNEGTINMAAGEHFLAPVGASVIISNGKIN